VKYKLYSLLCILFLIMCSPSLAAEVLVFAGSGMRVPLDELGKNFTAETGIQVAYDFDGSGRLGSKILMGVKPDIFVPGSDTWALKLKDEGYVKECVPVAYHTPVIITPKGNHKVKSLSDLTNKKIKLALGDARAAAIGRNNQRMFEKIGLNLSDLNVVARGVAVKQLVQWVESGSVDASIVWRADAVQSGHVETIDLPEGINLIDSIPLCLMSNPSHRDEASNFWTYLLKNGPEMFAKHGFQPIQLEQ
jgi:molybdate transport system substrate-binding protein